MTAGAFANVVNVIFRGDRRSVHRVLSNLRGLQELNADKTEILSLNTGRSMTYIEYYGVGII
jgi:hypothetical protein